MKNYELGALISAYITIPAESGEVAVDWMYNNFPSEVEITLKNGETARFTLQVDDVPNVRQITPAPALVEQESCPKRISKKEFFSRYKETGKSADAIFDDRPALMLKIWLSGNPIYCDQSYYVQEDHLDLVSMDGNHFTCSCYNKFEEWRECHYYYEFADDQGNKVWLMKGGRYD